MWFRRRPVLPTVSGYRTRETSKVRPSLPLGAASSRRAESVRSVHRGRGKTGVGSCLGSFTRLVNNKELPE